MLDLFKHQNFSYLFIICNLCKKKFSKKIHFFFPRSINPIWAHEKQCISLFIIFASILYWRFCAVLCCLGTYDVGNQTGGTAMKIVAHHDPNQISLNKEIYAKFSWIYKYYLLFRSPKKSSICTFWYRRLAW